MKLKIESVHQLCTLDNYRFKSVSGLPVQYIYSEEFLEEHKKADIYITTN